MKVIEDLGLSGEFDVECPVCGIVFEMIHYGEMVDGEEIEDQCPACGAGLALRLSMGRGLEVQANADDPDEEDEDTE